MAQIEDSINDFGYSSTVRKAYDVIANPVNAQAVSITGASLTFDQPRRLYAKASGNLVVIFPNEITEGVSNTASFAVTTGTFLPFMVAGVELTGSTASAGLFSFW